MEQVGWVGRGRGGEGRGGSEGRGGEGREVRGAMGVPESRGPGVRQFSGNHTMAENATGRQCVITKGFRL